MATQTVEFLAVYGQSLTAKLHTVGSDTVAQTASAVTEQTNRKGVYRATFTDAPAGEYELHVYTVTGSVPVARWYVTLALTTATFEAYDGAAKLAGITHTGARIPNVTLVDTTTTNTDMRGTDGALLSNSYVAPPTAGTIADAVWDESMTGHTTAGTYGGGIVRSQNSNVAVKISGTTGHVAADVHEFQPDAITAAAIAADAVAAIQAGLATVDNQRFLLSILAGTISNAGTSAEAYVIVLGGSTYTVTYAGLDATGNRGTTTLVKT